MPEWDAEIRARLSAVRLSPTREAEIVEEIAQHLDERWRELVAAGAREEEAERLARESFSRDPMLARHLSPLRQAQWTDPAPPGASRGWSLQGLDTDIRQAARALRATPSVTIPALVVLILGIGATTAIFSMVDGVVLRALPFPGASGIVALGERLQGGKKGPLQMSSDPEALGRVRPQNYLDWVAQQQVFASIAAIADSESTLVTTGADPEPIAVQRVTASFFDALRVSPARGVLFGADREIDGQNRVILLSDAFWRSRFGADPDIVGRALSLDGDDYQVIGVMPASFTYPVGAARPTQAWTPYVVPENERIRGRGFSLYLQVIARLRDGVTLDQARQQMKDVGAAIEKANPAWNRGTTIGIRPLRDHLVGASVRSWMLMLLSTVGAVLFIACANVASLLLARAAGRHRETAVRGALGASRWRLARLSMIEGLILSFVGTLLAIPLAWWGVSALRGTLPVDLPRAAAIEVNWRVLIAAACLALVTGAICGLLPGLVSSRPDLVESLNQSGRAGGAGRGRQRLRHALLVTELALALVLVVGSALFIRSFIRVMQIDAGFDRRHVITAQIYHRNVPGRPPVDLSASFVEIVERLQQVPGVLAASASAPGVPLQVPLHTDGFRVPGAAPPEIDRGVSIKRVTADYHRVLGISVKRGRVFSEADVRAEARVVVINETAAKRYFRDQDPVGRTAVVFQAERTIIGVVADARQGRFEAAPDPEVYLPMPASPTDSGYVTVRTTGNPNTVLPMLRGITSAVLPATALRNVATMEDLVHGQTAERRLTMLTMALLGVLGLLIAAVGVHGAMAYLVAQRTKEIGVRLALGASAGRVARSIFVRALLLVSAGIGLGGLVCWSLAGTVRAFLFGLDSAAGAGLAAAAALTISAALACVMPAWRAATVDPIVALRNE